MRLASRFTLGLVLPLWLGACAAPAGCQKHEAQDAGPAVVEDLSPIPAPEGLVGELFLPTPDATWSRARTVIGGPAAFLPQAFGGLAATLLKLPLALSAEIDGGVPVVSAVIKRGNLPAFAAVGLHVKAGDRFVDQLSRGPEARYTATRDEASHITLISPKQASEDGEPFVMGVLGNYLLVAEKLEALEAAGPYVARTLPTRTMPKEDLAFEIADAALSGPVLENLRTRWASVRSDTSNASLPLTPVADTIGALLDTLGDAKQARVTATLDEAGVHAQVTITPKPGDGPGAKAVAGMAVGDAAPLLDLPATTQVAVLWRDTAASRAAEVPAYTAALAKLVGEKASAEDKEAISAALRAESEARGDFGTFAFSLDPVGLGGAVRLAVADEDRMGKALKQLLDLAKRDHIKERLKANSLAVSAGKTVVENLPGDVQRVRFEWSNKDDKPADPKAAAIAAAPKTIDLLYLLDKGTLFGAFGGDPKEALRSMVKPSTEATLGSVAEVKGALTALGSTASLALVADPVRVVAARAGKSAPEASAPMVIAIGKTSAPAAMFGRVDVSARAVQEMVKHRNAF